MVQVEMEIVSVADMFLMSAGADVRKQPRHWAGADGNHVPASLRTKYTVSM